MQLPASYCKIEELPSPTRKPFCELDLHRRIRSFFLVPRGPQAGLGGRRQAIGVTAGQFAQEAPITGGGEALVSGASEGIRQSAGRLFLRIQTRFAQQRAAWLAGWLEEELLGDLLCELRRGAETPQSEPFRAAEEILAEMAGAGEPAGK
jgi:hypothetical protein